MGPMTWVGGSLTVGRLRDFIGRPEAIPEPFGLERGFRSLVRADLDSATAGDRTKPGGDSGIFGRIEPLRTFQKCHQRSAPSKSHRHASYVSYPTFVDEVQTKRVDSRAPNALDVALNNKHYADLRTRDPLHLRLN